MSDFHYLGVAIIEKDFNLLLRRLLESEQQLATVPEIMMSEPFNTGGPANSGDSPEAAVRRYLGFLQDPASAIDHDRVASLQSELANADDPIRRLKLESDLERARNADVDAITQGFVANAKAFADAENITVGAFSAQRVPTDVLAAAGFDVGGRGRGASRVSKPRSGRVSAAAVADNMLARSGQWKLNDVESDLGASTGTVRKVANELVESGKVRMLGADPNHDKRGRAPNLYSSN